MRLILATACLAALIGCAVGSVPTQAPTPFSQAANSATLVTKTSQMNPSLMVVWTASKVANYQAIYAVVSTNAGTSFSPPTRMTGTAIPGIEDLSQCAITTKSQDAAGKQISTETWYLFATRIVELGGVKAGEVLRWEIQYYTDNTLQLKAGTMKRIYGGSTDYKPLGVQCNGALNTLFVTDKGTLPGIYAVMADKTLPAYNVNADPAIANANGIPVTPPPWNNIQAPLNCVGVGCAPCRRGSTSAPSAVFVDNFGAAFWVNDGTAPASLGLPATSGNAGIWFAKKSPSNTFFANGPGRYQCSDAAKPYSATTRNSEYPRAKWGFMSLCSTYSTVPAVQYMMTPYYGMTPVQTSQCQMMGCDFSWGACTGASTMAVEAAGSKTTLFVAQGGPKVYRLGCKGYARRDLRDRRTSSAVASDNGANRNPSSSELTCDATATVIDFTGMANQPKAVGYMAFSNNMLFVTDKAGYGVYKITNPGVNSAFVAMGGRGRDLSAAPAATLIMDGMPSASGIFAFYASPASATGPAAMGALLVLALAKLLH